MKLDNLKAQIDDLIALATTTALSHSHYSSSAEFHVEDESHRRFRSAGLSFIGKIFGEQHSYYKEFFDATKESYKGSIREGRGILIAIKHEIDQGYLHTVRTLINAEIFTDFLDMSDYLLTEGYKDAAAVMLGSVLEEHLRQLCRKNAIAIDLVKDGKTLAKKADTMNSELASGGIYNKLDQKAVTTWLDLRNKAAHGHYSEYSKEQVRTMHSSILDFINRTV